MELMEHKADYRALMYGPTIVREYEILCERGESGSSPYWVPFVGELNKEVLQTAEFNEAEDLIKAAVLRREHEIYGIDPKAFLIEAYKGTIAGFRNTLPQREINYAVFIFLTTMYVSHTDYYDDIVHSPIRSVW